MTIDNLAKIIGLILSGIALAAAVNRFIMWIRGRRLKKVNEYKTIISMVEDLCSGQTYLEKQMNKISERLDSMDDERTYAREDDAHIRTRMYLGTVAVLDAIMRLAEHEGLQINGEIAQYRKENIENLKNGTGITRTKIFKGDL